LASTLSLLVAIALLSALSLQSCDDARRDLFVFNDPNALPDGINVYPYPVGQIFIDPVLARFDLQPAFQSWFLYYSTDPAALQTNAAAWTLYSPVSGILLFRNTTLRVFATNGADLVSPVFEFAYVFQGSGKVFFVQSGAAPGGDGQTPASAFSTLQQGIDAAAAAANADGPGIVRARGGLYAENPVMKGGVELYGSYGPDWKVDTPDGRPTSIIQSLAMAETPGATPYESVPAYGMRFPAGQGASARIEGIKVIGPPSGRNGAGLLSEGLGFNIRRCEFEGGGATGLAASVWVSTGNMLIEDSMIGGRSPSAVGETIGLLCLDASVVLRHTAVKVGQVDGATFMAGIKVQDMPGPALPVLTCEDSPHIFSGGGTDVYQSAGVVVAGGSASLVRCSLIQGEGAWADEGRSAGVIVGSSPSGSRGNLRVEASSVRAMQGPHSSDNVTGAWAAPGGDLIISNCPEIGAMGGSYVSAVLAGTSGASLSLSGNGLIYAGDGIFSTIGVEIRADAAFSGPAVIERNSVWSRPQSDFGAGILVDCQANPSYPLIVRNNRIVGSQVSGFTPPNPDPSIRIRCGLVVGSGTSVLSHAVQVHNNDIWALSGAPYGVSLKLAFPSHLSFFNNIIRCNDGYGIRFQASTNALDQFENNVVFGTYGAYVRAFGGVFSNDITPSSDNLDAPDPQNSYRGGPLNDNPWGFINYDASLSPSAPAELLSGGLDLSGLLPAPLGFNEDFAGNPRSPGWSRGAVEAP
jgi:hypothetical protein